MRRLSDVVSRVETNVVAFLMAAITIVSFSQVVARYVFNTGWSGALEFTRILFAWLILFGMAYGIKRSAHLGVDAFIRLFPKPVFKALAIFGALCGVLYAVTLLYSNWLQVFGLPTKGGAIDYWLKIYKIGIGLDDLRYPDWAQEWFGTRERVERWIAYLILPIGLALLALRCLQGAIQVWRGEREMIIAAHEAEELVQENLGAAAGEGESPAAGPRP